MRVVETDLPGVKLIELDVFSDERGVFVETYDSSAFAALGINDEFVHDSFSLSHHLGTVRGFHFQRPPRSQAKLVRVTRGRVFDVVVDLRPDSGHFGRSVTFELEASAPRWVLIPHGFGHAFCTLNDDTEIVYKMSDHFTPDLYAGVLWCDPALGIGWPIGVDEAIVSSKDAAHPALADAGLEGLAWPLGGTG